MSISIVTKGILPVVLIRDVITEIIYPLEGYIEDTTELTGEVVQTLQLEGVVECK